MGLGLTWPARAQPTSLTLWVSVRGSAPGASRSCGTCIATAVEDSAMPPPRMMAPAPVTLLCSSVAVMAIAAVVASTWKHMPAVCQRCCERDPLAPRDHNSRRETANV